MRHLILEVNCGIGEGGFACGPVDGPVVCEVKLQLDDGTKTYYCLTESLGCPNFYQTDKSTFQEQVDEDMDDELISYMNDHYIDGGDYSDIFEAGDENEDLQIFRYLIYLVRCPREKEEEFIKNTVGQYIEDLTIPKSDVEHTGLSYEQLKSMSDDARSEYLSQLDDDEADELLDELLSELSEDDDVTGQVYGGQNCYFVIHDGDISEISDNASYNPRGSWFPDIVSGLSEETLNMMNAIIEKLGGFDVLDSMFSAILDEGYDEFDDDDALELFHGYEDDEEDEETEEEEDEDEDEDEADEDNENKENELLYRALMSEIEKADGRFVNGFDFYQKMRRMDLEAGVLYYEWEGEYIDFHENVWDCGEGRGTYEDLTAVEWINVLCHLDDDKVTASED